MAGKFFDFFKTFFHLCSLCKYKAAKVVVYIGYLENIIVLLRWDADNYLPDREKEKEIYERIQDVIRENQKEEKGEEDYETYKIFEKTSE